MTDFLADALSLRLSYPMEGPWTERGFPLLITVMDFPFRRARWSQRCPGVLVQYRERCQHQSMHLKVVRNSRGALLWHIDHDDKYNPDAAPGGRRFGRPFAHFFHDYPPGMIAKPAAVTAVGWGLTRLL
jgi:hypothetical protein